MTTWPLALSTREQGEANHYAITNGNSWLALLQINGTLTELAQADFVRLVAAAPQLFYALEQLHANPANQIAQRRASAALQLVGSTECLRNYFAGVARERGAQKFSYDDYMERLRMTLASAAPGQVLQLAPQVVATLLDGSPVWFDVSEGIMEACEFDRQDWHHDCACWNDDTSAMETWGVFDPPVFVTLDTAGSVTT